MPIKITGEVFFNLIFFIPWPSDPFSYKKKEYSYILPMGTEHLFLGSYVLNYAFKISFFLSKGVFNHFNTHDSIFNAKNIYRYLHFFAFFLDTKSSSMSMSEKRDMISTKFGFDYDKLKRLWQKCTNFPNNLSIKILWELKLFSNPNTHTLNSWKLWSL